jgi:hypothetical protein
MDMGCEEVKWTEPAQAGSCRHGSECHGSINGRGFATKLSRKNLSTKIVNVCTYSLMFLFIYLLIGLCTYIFTHFFTGAFICLTLKRRTYLLQILSLIYVI